MSNEETTFGIDVTSVLDAYQEAVDKANNNYALVYDHHQANANEAASAIRKAVGYRSALSGHLIDMLYTIASENDAITEAREILDAALAKAEETKAEALNADPFTRYVSTTFAEAEGETRADIILRNSPFTFASLRRLADEQGWCYEFEQLADKARRAGAIPDDTVECHLTVSNYRVPEQYGAQPGETWKQVHQVYAFYRFDDDHQPSYSHLPRYSKGEPTYVKVADAPVDTEPSTDDDPES